MKIILSILLIYFITVNLLAQEIAPSEVERKKVVEKKDKKGLRFKTQAVTEESGEFIKIPEFNLLHYFCIKQFI